MILFHVKMLTIYRNTEVCSRMYTLWCMDKTQSVQDKTYMLDKWCLEVSSFFTNTHTHTHTHEILAGHIYFCQEDKFQHRALSVFLSPDGELKFVSKKLRYFTINICSMY